MLVPQQSYDIPCETQRVARAAFPKGNVYMQLRDELGHLYTDEMFGDLFSSTGQPAQAPWRLAWVTILQFAEGLTDRQAADAVRDRVAWKYVLSLSLEDAGFHYSVLSEFRDRLVRHDVGLRLFNTLLEACQQQGWTVPGGRQRTDSTHVLAAIQRLNRLELVGQTLQHALNTLATIAPIWLKSQLPTEWWDRYAKKLDSYRLPKSETERRLLAEQIGRDGLFLLALVEQGGTPSDVGKLHEVMILSQIWNEQYLWDPDHTNLRWRDRHTLPPAADRMVSPHDQDARYSSKRETEWAGYKVHLTEACEPDQPHLIVHVETTVATVQDVEVVPPIHHALQQRQLLPDTQIMDSGYISAAHIVDCDTIYDVTLLGPVRPDVSWQAQHPEAYDVTAFDIDWEAQQVTCPQGHMSSYWQSHTGLRGNPIIEINFRKTHCGPCPMRSLCTRSKSGPRVLTLLPQTEFEALQHARQQQTTDDFQKQYQKRAGIEGTIGQAANAYGMRQARYIGLEKTRLQHLATATAINLQRIAAWLDRTPLAPTRVSAFARLAV